MPRAILVGIAFALTAVDVETSPSHEYAAYSLLFRL